MIYTELTRKAMKIAFEAHSGQVDKAGLPYINHPLHLAEQMHTEDTCVVALLHDVVEDTPVTLEELRRAGFTENQLQAIGAMTHKKGVAYMDYVKELRKNKIAAVVKMADIQHNSDITRIANPTKNDIKRLDKYKEALEYLKTA